MDLRASLQGIYEARGKLTPDIVLDEARDASHPLHNRFEWDDSVAAEAFRREQARQLIKTVKLVYRPAEEGGSMRSVRAFHALPTEEGYRYEPVEKIVEDPVMREIVRREMNRAWRELHTRYAQFEEFWKMIDETKETVAA